MPTLRRQVIMDPAAGTSDGNYTNTRHASYTQIYVNTTFIGGAETFTWRETNGTHKIPQIGNDRTENVRGMRYISGSLGRFQIRGNDMRQVYQSLFPNTSDIDFSTLPTTWRVHYLVQSTSGNGGPGVNYFEDAWWVFYNVIITDYEFSVPNANDVLRDSVTFIADGVESWSNKGARISPLHTLLGNGQGGPNGANDFGGSLPTSSGNVTQ